MNFYDFRKDAVTALRDALESAFTPPAYEGYDDVDKVEDIIFEAADSATPDYDSDILALAIDYPDFATETPDRGVQKGDTAITLMSANIFAWLGELFREEYCQWKEEIVLLLEEDEDEESEDEQEDDAE